MNLRTVHIYIAGGIISVASISFLLLSNISSPRESRASEAVTTADRYEVASTENITYDNFTLLSNSFSDAISARYTSGKREDVSMKLVTMKGSVVLFENFSVKTGENFLRCRVPASLPRETYILFLENKDSVLATGVVAFSQ
jgi:hypothetical protein